MIERKAKWIQVASSLNEVSQSIKFLEAQKAEFSKQLQELSKGVNSCGGGFEYKQIDRKGCVDCKLISELYDIDLDSFRKQSTSFWKMSLSNPIVIKDIK